MPRTTGTYATSTTLGESIPAFVPRPLPPADPRLAPTCFVDLNRRRNWPWRAWQGCQGWSRRWTGCLQCHPQGGIAHLADRGHPSHTDRPVRRRSRHQGQQHRRCRGGHQLPVRLPLGAGAVARRAGSADQRSPAVRGAPLAARWCARRRQAARRAAPFAELDRRDAGRATLPSCRPRHSRWSIC